MLLLFLLLWPTNGLSVYDSGLGEPIYGDEKLTTDFATLEVDEVANLPTEFTICSSTSTDSYQTAQNLFLLLRETGEPWSHMARPGTQAFSRR